jgi:glycosyltransferase involved in cell wall biosynthesis
MLDVDPAKTSVIHHGFALTVPAAIATFEAPPRPFLLFVGKRCGYKNFAGLLQAFAGSSTLRRDFDVVCFGGGPFNSADHMAVRQAGLRPHQVHQRGGSDAVLAELYRRARAFVYPSFYEGFGIPPLEAMSFDCPVVCSDASSIPEVVGDAALMFDAHDPEAIRQCLEQVVADEALRKELVAQGRRRLEKFSWGRCARETLSVYKQLVS